MACRTSTSMYFDTVEDIIHALGRDHLDSKSEDKIVKSIQMIALKSPQVSLVPLIDYVKNSIHVNNKALTSVLRITIIPAGSVSLPSSSLSMGETKVQARSESKSETKGDYKTYVERFEKGDISMLLKMAECLEEGKDGATQNYAEAFKFYEKAATEYHIASAMYKLSYFFDNGLGVVKNPEQAEKCMRIAARMEQETELAMQGKGNMIGALTGAGKSLSTQSTQSQVNQSPLTRVITSFARLERIDNRIDDVRDVKKLLEESYGLIEKHDPEKRIKMFAVYRNCARVIDFVTYYSCSLVSVRHMLKFGNNDVSLMDMEAFYEIEKREEEYRKILVDLKMNEVFEICGEMWEERKSQNQDKIDDIKRAINCYKRSLEIVNNKNVVFLYHRAAWGIEKKGSPETRMLVEGIEKLANEGVVEAIKFMIDHYYKIDNKVKVREYATKLSMANGVPLGSDIKDMKDVKELEKVDIARCMTELAIVSKQLASGSASTNLTYCITEARKLMDKIEAASRVVNAKRVDVKDSRDVKENKENKTMREGKSEEKSSDDGEVQVLL